MSSKLQPVRGTQDLFSDQALVYRHIDQIAFSTSQLFGYEEIKTPIFEFSEVFHRSLGETSDAVSKETYDFKDRGGESLTLRPEGTAGVVRAFISNGMAQNLPLKFYYSGPMFRYERPQKGRYRQFHQLGVESLGYEDSYSDVESISLAKNILDKLGLKEKVCLEINTLGDKESRDKHRTALVDFLKPKADQLSEDSKIRLQKNPLRILDSKDENDKKIVSEAPKLENYLNDNSKKFFDDVLNGLERIGINYKINNHLVRGLDYYTHTVFEFTTDQLGAQGTVLAGGRYDGLVAMMGGTPTAGVGWASGIERLILLSELSQYQNKSKLISIVAADEKANIFCEKLTWKLRQNSIRTELLTSGNVGKKMKRAGKIGSNFVIIVGENELNKNSVTLKNFSSGEQSEVKESELLSHLLKLSSMNSN